MNLSLTPEKALLFRITHIDNLHWILLNGLHCRNSTRSDPNFTEIGLKELIDKRKTRKVPIPPGGTLSDYVPFYFTPHSPMLLNIKTGKGVKARPMADIVMLVTSLPHLRQQGLKFIFTTQHAYPATTEYYSDLTDLRRIDWQILQARDFARDLNDLGKMDRYMAEGLVHREVTLSALLGVICYDPRSEKRVQQLLDLVGSSLKLVVKPGWYF
jgi:ssDNA thymidine ADP-ribosyltransferase, DarT